MKINLPPVKKLWVLLVMAFALSGLHQVNERTVTGKVTNADDGVAVPGLHVLVKGTVVGTVTNARGEYQINAPGNDAILTFSFIGLKTQEIQLGAQAVVNVAMEPDAMQLSEIVANAICFEKKSEIVTTSKKRKRKNTK